MEDNAAENDVRAQYEQGDADWHGNFLVIVRVAVFKQILDEDLLVGLVVVELLVLLEWLWKK